MAYQPYGAQPYGAQPWGATGLPQVFVPPQQAAYVPDQSSESRGNLEAGGQEQFLTGVAGTVLKQQGRTYLRKGRSWLSSLGVLGVEDFSAYFDVTPSYVLRRLVAVLAPFVRLGRGRDGRGGHLAGGARGDLASPDLYVPLVSAWTFCLLLAWKGVAAAAALAAALAAEAAEAAKAAGEGGSAAKAALLRSGAKLSSASSLSGSAFLSSRAALAAAPFHSAPEAVALAVSRAFGAWVFAAVLARAALWYLGAPRGSAPALRVLAATGYMFVPATLALVAGGLGSRAVGHVVWAYASGVSATFLVRALKRLVLKDARGLTEGNRRRINYVLLGLALLQFPLMARLIR